MNHITMVLVFWFSYSILSGLHAPGVLGSYEETAHPVDAWTIIMISLLWDILPDIRTPYYVEECHAM